jgi:hypothetical protein
MDQRTTEILQQFDASWRQTRAIFEELITSYDGFERLIPVREFIDEMEQAGGKELYRLGTSIHMLIISRSVNHGLRADQKFIRIEAFATNSFEVLLGDGDRIYRTYRVKDLRDARIAKLLQTLKETLVD